MLTEERQKFYEQRAESLDRWHHYLGTVLDGMQLNEKNLEKLLHWLVENEHVFEEERIGNVLNSHVWFSLFKYKKLHAGKTLRELFPSLLDWDADGPVRNFLVDMDERTNKD